MDDECLSGDRRPTTDDDDDNKKNIPLNQAADGVLIVLALSGSLVRKWLLVLLETLAIR